MEGNIDKLLNILGGLNSHIQNHMGDALERAGEIVRKHVVTGIRDQRWPMPPLAARTIDRKMKLRQSRLILIARGDYFASFAVARVSWDEVHMGTNHAQGRRLEFGYPPGSKDITPSRPHVGPALDDSRDEVLEELLEGYKTVFEAR